MKPGSALSYWNNKLLPSRLPLWKLAPERGLSFARLKKSSAISRGRLMNMSNGKFSGKSFLVLKMGRGVLLHFMASFGRSVAWKLWMLRPKVCLRS